MKTLSLKLRFAFAMSIGALALVFGMGAISLHYAQRDLLATVSSQQLALVTQAAGDFDSRLRLATDSLAAFAAAIPRDVIASDVRFDAFFAGDPALLQMFDDILVLDAAGVVAADHPSRENRIGVDLSDRGFIGRAMASGEPVISEPLFGKVSGKPLIAVAAPIVDGDGKALALLVGLLRLDKNKLLGEPSSVRLGQNGYFTVVSTGAEPLFLAHPDAARLMQPVPRASGRVFAKVVGANAPGVVTGRLDDGGEVLVSYSPLAMTRWTIAAVLPRSEAFAAIDGARDRTLLVAVGAALVVLPLVWLFAWRLLLPLSALRAQVEAIAADPSTTATATPGSDEVGQVALAFNAMLHGQRTSEARMLSIADALPVLVAFIDCDYRFVFVNSRYEDHFGMDRADMIGKSIAGLIGLAAFERYLPYLQQAARGETQVFEIESRVGPRPAHFLVKLIPQVDEGHQLIGYHFIHQDVTDHKAEHQRLSQLVHADALTGVLNRAGFEVAIDDAMQRSRNHASPMALLYLDVDRFKSINDRHGHLVGDALLRAFADRLVHALRGADVTARLGGDEFVVIAEGLRNVADVRSIAGEIVAAMRPAFEVEGVMLSITTSVGVATYAGEPIEAEQLIGRADAALYRAKKAGRDRYDLDDPSGGPAGAAGAAEDHDPAAEMSLHL